MTYVDQYYMNWKVLNHARSTVEAELSNAASLTVNVPYMAYGTTWATTDAPHCAQNFTKRPASAVQITQEDKYNFIRMRFLVADTADDEVTGTLWGWDGSSAPINLLVVNPIRAGTAVNYSEPAFPGGSLRHLPFTSGGALAIASGDTITGATSAATAVVSHVVVTSGTWAAGTAAGALFLASISGTFQSENLNTTSQNNIATIAADVVDFRWADTLTVTTDHIGYETRGTSAGNGILEFHAMDLTGINWLFFDFDCDLGSGTDGTDGICLFKGY